MASDIPQLSLDLSPPISDISSLFSRFLVVRISDFGEFSKLNDFINKLEDEIKKVQAFQSELPLSFLILTDAISKLKEGLKKNDDRQRDGKVDGFDEFEKKKWMSSVQLWSPRNEGGGDYEPRKGALLSFNSKATDDVTGLSLVPPGLSKVEPVSAKLRTGGNFSGSIFPAVHQSAKPVTKPLYQSSRKRRRCWSPELHRQFVDALEKLGGPQVATPKQIRELMQVDGLTNDEVKSHLQKYRLHVRKLPAASITNQLSTDVEMDCRDQLELGCLTMDLQHSSSPKGPLHLRKCNSSSVEEDEEEKSDGQSWKVQHQM